MSDGTGRLHRTADPAVRRLLFDHRAGRPAWKEELDRITQVDLAHVVMLCEQRIIDVDRAATLLDAIVDVRCRDFGPLEHRPTPRGLYLAYEGHLIDRLGEEVGGVLHTGRSRNDLGATCAALALRRPYRRLTEELVRLGIVLLRQARQHRATLMPAYTHFQPAVPITFGHQLLALATALERDLDAVVHAGRGLDRCALGAGAIGGTTIPIDPARTAELLGFGAPVASSVDAIASRDTVLRLVAAAAILGVTVDRAALDLLVWSSDRGFVTLSDGVVGSSSMMPQKRNPFVLEHVQGRSAAALGAFVGAVAAMRGTPFTNSIAVGGEGASQAAAGLEPAIDAVELLRRCVAGVEVDADAMARRAETGLTTATAVAEQLVTAGVPFRRAHHDVGTAVCAVLEGRADTLVAAVTDVMGPDGPVVDGAAADAVAVRAAADHGGGPGPTAFGRGWCAATERWRHQRGEIRRQTRRWDAAEARLASAVDQIRALGTSSPGVPPTERSRCADRR